MKSLKREDLVVVIAGNDKGKTGKVLSVDKVKGRVVVENVAVVKKHVRKSQDYPNGTVIERPASIDISNVMLKSKRDERLSKKANKKA